MPSVTPARHFPIKCTCAWLSQKDRGRWGGRIERGWWRVMYGREKERLLSWWAQIRLWVDQPFLIELCCEKRRSSISAKDGVVLLVDGLIVIVLQVPQLFRVQFPWCSALLRFTHTRIHTPTHTHADGRTEQCSSWKVHLKYVFISFWNVDYIGRKYLQPFSPICPGRSYLSMQHLEGFFCWRSPFSVYLSTKNSSENNCLSLNRPKSLNSTLEKAAWECKLLCDIVTKRQNAVEGLESQGTTGMKKKSQKNI